MNFNDNPGCIVCHIARRAGFVVDTDHWCKVAVDLDTDMDPPEETQNDD